MKYIVVCDNEIQSIKNAISCKNPKDVFVIVDGDSISDATAVSKIVKNIKAAKGNVKQVVAEYQEKLGDVTILDERSVIKFDLEFVGKQHSRNSGVKA